MINRLATVSPSGAAVNIQSQKPNLKNSPDNFDQRSERLLGAARRESSNPRESCWGPYRHFDGLHLALYASGDHLGGDALLEGALAMVQKNIDDEVSGAGDKWHLGDFALHPILRLLWQFPGVVRGDLAKQAEGQLIGYLYHFGDLTENHNLLHLALRYLVGHRFPADMFRDGRPGEAHADEARLEILKWAALWFEQGSGEWGSDIYYNVNYLSMLNLFDFAHDTDVKEAATGLLDLLALDVALDLHSGSFRGSARRGYACYRMGPKHSPSRPVAYLWFRASDDRDFWVPYFCGGAVVAAVSSYRPPAAVVALAQHPDEVESRSFNARPFYMTDAIPGHRSHRVSLRHPLVNLSSTLIPASPSRYTDFTWFVSLGEKGVTLMGNHPSFEGSPAMPPGFQWDKTPQGMLALYEKGNLPAWEDPLWVPGNVPPGAPGDLRPGFWQGHASAPACFQKGDLCLVNYLLSPEHLDFTHLFLPRPELDEVVVDGPWVFAKSGGGYFALWSSAPITEIKNGTWANRELRFSGRRQGQVVQVGRQGRDGNFPSFIKRATSAKPQYNPQTNEISAALGDLRLVLTLSGIQNPETHLPDRARVMTAFGGIPQGGGELKLNVGNAHHHRDYGWLRAYL